MAGQNVQSDWKESLKQPEVQESLRTLVERLPDLVESLEKVDEAVSFGRNVMNDKQTMEELKNRLEYTNVDLDTLEAGLKLLEKLPKLLELVEKLETAVEFIENVLKDQESLEYLQDSAKTYMEPVQKRVDDGVNFWKEVQAKAESNQQHISIFTVLKWMKDPNVQKGLSYVQAFIDTMPKSR
ncbi:MAG: DUF1641 domain-containing protein [Bacillaceae bacterium]|nr:DUF1641 domain-containing protein [Bacillaceae bacterium]